ncbi:hypothetical protein PFISCL1PPCAC_4921, partial [Pristionchus fissidentatus]
SMKFLVAVILSIAFFTAVEALPAPSALTDPDFSGQFMFPLRETRSSFGMMHGGMGGGRNGNFVVIDGRAYRINK